MGWTWVDKVKGFFNKVLDRVLGKREILPIEKATTARGEALVGRITEGLISGSTSVGTWERQMREALKTTYIQNYLLGIGGQGNLTQKDFGSIGGMLGEQYKYLSNFAQQIADEKLTSAQIQMRAAMYARSAREGFFRADARAWGIIDGKLPAYPGDGSTRCLTNCGCSWEFEDALDERGNVIGVDCYWVVNPAMENCEDCLENMSTWNPYTVES